MAGSVRLEAHTSGLLASLERNLASLAKARDPQTADLAYELQNAIDKLRAELDLGSEIINPPERIAR